MLAVAPANPASYQRHRPEETTLYRVVQAHLDTHLAFVDIETGGVGLPTFVTDEFEAFLACGILAQGFLLRPIRLTMSYPKRRCADGFCNFRFPCAVPLPFIPTCLHRHCRSANGRLPRFSSHIPATSAIRPPAVLSRSSSASARPRATAIRKIRGHI